jgi:GLPGLI family protein
MKKMMLLLAVAGITTTTAMAQDKSQGKINYDVTLNVHASLKPDQLQYKDMLPETVVSKDVLYFNGGKTHLIHDQSESTTDDGAKIKFETNQGERALYTDGATGKTWSVIEEDGKKTLILKEKDEKEKMGESKAGTRTKEILGFTCREMTIENKEAGSMTLWVTDLLPFSTGPMGFSAGKGAILGIDNKKLNIIATAISYSPVSVSEVSIPTDVPVKSDKK